MGKTQKVSKGYSSGFVPDYRHAVETMAESEGFGSSGRVDHELTGSEDSCAPKRKSINLNSDGYDKFGLPMQFLSLSTMSNMERRGLEVKLKSELEQVKVLQRKIASFNFDAMVSPSATNVHNYDNGPNRPAFGNKKSRPVSKGPHTKGGLVARNTESMKQSIPQNTNYGVWKKHCAALLRQVMKHKHAWIFNEPVDIVTMKVPDYYNVIKHPMDLGTVKKKLSANQYSSPMGFAADVRLTFKNAMTYNSPGHDVHIMALTLSKMFESKWELIEKKIPVSADDSTPSKSSIVIEPEFVSVPPAKKRKNAPPMENRFIRQETEKRVMSDLDKQKMTAELEDLLAELPDNIIDFLKEKSSNGGQVSEDEIEIDLDTLSDDTLFSLRKLLDDYLIEKQKKQAEPEPSQIEIHNESSVQPCKNIETADMDVDIGGNDPPHISSFTPVKIDKDTTQRNSKCSSSSSSSSESGSSSSDSDSEGSSGGESDGPKDSVRGRSSKEIVVSGLEVKDTDLNDTNDRLKGSDDQNPVSAEPNSQQEGESAPTDRQVSPDKLYRAAILRSRFADIIIKAQENNIEKGERPDPEKLKLEREELERRRREEKARLQAEAKAVEDARKKAEAEAEAEAKKKREIEREAARQALQMMEKTVDINGSNRFMEDLEMFRAAPDEILQSSFVEEASPENSQNGLGSFKFQANSNPLEQLGLYMRNDEDEIEDEEIEPTRTPEISNDPEEGEID